MEYLKSPVSILYNMNSELKHFFYKDTAVPDGRTGEFYKILKKKIPILPNILKI